MQGDYGGGIDNPALPHACGWELGREPTVQTLWLTPSRPLQQRVQGLAQVGAQGS